MSQVTERELELLLTNEQTSVNSLTQILKAEFTALSEQDIAALRVISNEKKQALEYFNTQVQKRLEYLSTHLIDCSELDFLNLVETLPESAQTQLIPQWNKLKISFEEVQKLNLKNGLIIQHSQVRTKAVLGILQGQINKPNLYDQAGSAQSSNTGHKLGEA